MTQVALLVSVPSNAMASRPLELPWLPSTPVEPNAAIMEISRTAGCGWRESARLAAPLFLTVFPVNVNVAGETLLGLNRLMPKVPAPSMVLLVMET